MNLCARKRIRRRRSERVRRAFGGSDEVTKRMEGREEALNGGFDGFGGIFEIVEFGLEHVGEALPRCFCWLKLLW